MQPLLNGFKEQDNMDYDPIEIQIRMFEYANIMLAQLRDDQHGTRSNLVC